MGTRAKPRQLEPNKHTFQDICVNYVLERKTEKQASLFLQWLSKRRLAGVVWQPLVSMEGRHWRMISIEKAKPRNKEKLSAGDTKLGLWRLQSHSICIWVSLPLEFSPMWVDSFPHCLNLLAMSFLSHKIVRTCSRMYSSHSTCSPCNGVHTLPPEKWGLSPGRAHHCLSKEVEPQFCVASGLRHKKVEVPSHMLLHHLLWKSSHYPVRGV